MKLFFIVDNNEPHSSGGGYSSIFKFAEFLSMRGHDVFIYAVNDLGWVQPNDKIQLYYRPKIKRRNRWMRKCDKLLELFCDKVIIPRLVRQFNPDWVLGVLKESAIKAVSIANQFNLPVANFIYECPPWLREIYGEEIYQQQNHGYTRKLWEATKEAYLASDILFPNSELSQQYNQNWLQSVSVAEPIFPGVDIDQMPFDGPKDSSSGKSVLYAGRLVWEKNVHHLIEAWKKMPSEITLNITGKGPMAEQLQSQASGMSNVVFHGFVDDERLWELFRSTTMLICPTQFEGFGHPPLQALYFEKPCLASDLPILRSIYGDHLDYFPMGDIDAIVEGVLRIINDAPYAESKGKQGRPFVLENFSWAMSAERIEKHLLAHKHTSH